MMRISQKCTPDMMRKLSPEDGNLLGAISRNGPTFAFGFRHRYIPVYITGYSLFTWRPWHCYFWLEMEEKCYSTKQLISLYSVKKSLFSRTTWERWALMKQQMMGWQWHQLNYTQVISTSRQTDNHASTS